MLVLFVVRLCTLCWSCKARAHLNICILWDSLVVNCAEMAEQIKLTYPHQRLHYISRDVGPEIIPRSLCQTPCLATA